MTLDVVVDYRARAIRLLFQPLLVLWALWSTTALPQGSFKRLWNYFTRTIRENKVATIIGILIGGVGTRFLEDSNLLVNGVLTLMITTSITLCWNLVRRMKRPTW